MAKYVSKAEWHDRVRATRMELGDALRDAHEEAEPLMLDVERGLRWESQESARAIDAADALLDQAKVTHKSIEALAAANTRISPSERTRLEDALLFVRQGRKLLKSISGKEMVALSHKWEDEGLAIDKAHEAYFLQRFTAAMRVLRLAWNKLFYATQMPSVRRITLDLRESSAYYDPMSGIREAVHQQAAELADRSGKYVEVYDDDGDMVYVAQPSGAGAARKAELTRATARARAKKPKTRPIKRRMTNNPSTVEYALFEELWSYPY